MVVKKTWLTWSGAVKSIMDWQITKYFFVISLLIFCFIYYYYFVLNVMICYVKTYSVFSLLYAEKIFTFERQKPENLRHCFALVA